MFKTMRVSLYSGWIAVLLLTITIMGALAQGNGNRKFVAGEMVITVPRGTARAVVDDIAGKVNAAVVKGLGTIDYARTLDCYHLRMKTQVADNVTLAAVDSLNADARVKGAWTNYIHQYFQTSGSATSIPNDPRYGEQWDKPFLRMPEAWFLQKGKSNVVLAILDSGLDQGHPEFPGTRIFKPWDPNTLTTNTTDNNGHGTHVAGIAGAQANNATGIAGNAWENVRIMPVKLGDAGPTAVGIIGGFQHVIDQVIANPDKWFVVNCSFGGYMQGIQDTPTPEQLLPTELCVINAAMHNAVLCISAGNNGDGRDPSAPANTTATPARMAGLFKNVICVGSVESTGTRSPYSQFRPYTTIVAPGGDDTGSKQILSTIPTAQGSYGLKAGTSMSSPQVAGIAALLLSNPGVDPSKVKGILTSTARPVGTAPNAEYGYGIADAFKALQAVAVYVNVQSPDGTGGRANLNPHTPDPVETLRPPIIINVRYITPDKLVIKVDGTTIPRCTSPTDPGPCYTVENVTLTTKDANGNDVGLVYDAVIRNMDLTPGTHKIDVTGTMPGNPDFVTSDTRTITVQPRLVPAGRAMISIPYYQKDGPTPGVALTPEDLLGTDFMLARWVPEQERYAFYSSFGVRDPYASFQPPDVVPHIDGDPTPISPLGLAWWSDTESAKPVLTRGVALNQTVVIPLKGNGTGSSRFVSWNMIGSPFPFDVPFNAILVDSPVGRISVSDAVTRGYLLPTVYSYDTQNGYTWRSLPDGALKAWSGHWIGVTSKDNISLVVPPITTVGRAAEGSVPEPTVHGGWSLRLSAATKSLRDTFNFIGAGGKVSDGYGLEDVVEPPSVAPYISLGIDHSGDWGRQSAIYAADFRSAGGSKKWSVVVNTDQANSDVMLTWSGRTLPRGVSLQIKDETNGQVVDMRTRTSLTFNTGDKPGIRKFTVTSRQQINGGLRITNVAVQPTRGVSGGHGVRFALTADASYDVKILNGSGGHTATITSRAGAAGDVQLHWNGKDTAGRNVASGVYMVQIRATTPDGDNVKVIYPFQVVR